MSPVAAHANRISLETFGRLERQASTQELGQVLPLMATPAAAVAATVTFTAGCFLLGIGAGMAAGD